MSAKAIFLKSDGVKLPDNVFERITEEELNRPFTFDQKKRIAEKIDILSKDAHLEIFFLLKRNDAKFTSNHNGMFFNINSIPDKVLNRLDKLVEFCYQNERNLAKSYDKRFRSYPDTISNISECSNESDEPDNSSDSSDIDQLKLTRTDSVRKI